MQIIEVTDLAGVRSARWTFGSTASRLRFVLFPMIHLAEARFYEEVTTHLRSCDLIVAEGVGGPRASASRCWCPTWMPTSSRTDGGASPASSR